MGIVSNIKSGIIKNEILKSLDKLDPTLLVPAIENVLESIGLTDKDKAEIRVELRNKLMDLIRGLISKG
mgnify:CR=1 FL=1